MKDSYPLLDTIQLPHDLRKLSPDDLPALAQEIRQALLDIVSKNGGHFAASLGVVELTVALHYLYNTPDDRLVWDVGHQAYVHKMLTGRCANLETIRKAKGIAPFPKREESKYDTFGVGHSSTSIGAAAGMAVAARHQELKRRVVAIIGDGGLTAGMAFEALNHVGDENLDMLVILNDNNMSISPNVGALSNRFAQLLSSKLYTSFRESGLRALNKVPSVQKIARRTEEHMKGLIIPGTLFQEFGFNYVGPVDGHDLDILLKTLGNLRNMKGPQFLHILTKKGKGYKLAEADPVKYHGVSPFDAEQGIQSKANKPSPLTYSKVFGKWLCDMAQHDPKLVAITPAMSEGSGMVEFSKTFPDRYFDVGIAEQHSVTLAAGMACDGLKPVVAIYSSFLQRAYDQLIHDVVLQQLPVLFAIDRAGLVGPDGPTHNGSYDISFLRCQPGLVIMAPADEDECRQMLYTGFKLGLPVAVRYPRGAGPGVEPKEKMQSLPIGKGVVLQEGKKIALLAFGSMCHTAQVVGSKLGATVVNMRFIKPLDVDLIRSLAETHSYLVTLEENVVAGGAGEAVNLVLNELQLPRGKRCRLRCIGIPDRFIEHGSREEMLADAALDEMSLQLSIEQFLSTK